MNLSFPQLMVVNFGSFIGEHKFDIADYGPGLHFFRGRNRFEPDLGSNGAGKSTLFNALCWCLTGKTVDGRRNPDIEPRFGPKETWVTVLVEGDEREQHSISRTTHPNSLTIDGETAGQDEVDKMIRLPFNVLTHTMFLGQGQPLFFDLEPRKKMEVLGEVLNLDRWDERSDKARTKLSDLENQEATLIGTLGALDRQRYQLRDLIRENKEKWAAWQDEQNKQMRAAGKTLKEWQARYEQLEQERAGYDLAYDSAETELRALQRKSKELSESVTSLVGESARHYSSKDVINNAQNRRRRELEALGEADVCPTCGQSLKGTDLRKHKLELKQDLRKYDEQINAAQRTIDKIDAQLKELRAALSRSQDSENAFRQKSEKARDGLDRLTPELAKLKASIEQLQNNIKQAPDNPYDEQLRSLRKALSKVKNQVEEGDSRLKVLNRKRERTKFWVQGFKDIRLYIIEDILQELELTTNVSLAEVGLVDWEVRYAIEKETKSGTIQRGLNVFILSPRDQKPVRWECWSGGEAQRLRLVGALALSEVLLARAGVELGMEILDEPTQHLSGEGAHDLVEYLANRAKALDRQIFYIDHLSRESARFASVTTIVKTKKGSEIAA